ncbi:MAG: methyltransferase domain-containing protein [Ilumatobacter sp.]|nr:methyltransferase domain-containing protein [Ilumatobacter sp.]
MHDSSYAKMASFVRVHLAAHRGQPLDIIDFGSQMVDGQQLSYRTLFDDPSWTYRGLDIESGHNVDIVVTDAYDWSEVASDSVDLVISGQAFEHVEYFWASMFEIVRTLKPGGIAAIIAPSGGFEHRFPVDCWRFYPDGLVALTSHVQCEVVDVFTDWGNLDWEDSVLVARKPDWDVDRRRLFERRSMLQRALLGDDLPDELRLDPGAHPDDLAPSALAALTTGALTAELDAARTARLEQEAAARHAAAAASRAQAAELDALRAHVAGLDHAPGPVERAYGIVRAHIARLVGERGRRLYKRLRGRV